MPPGFSLSFLFVLKSSHRPPARSSFFQRVGGSRFWRDSLDVGRCQEAHLEGVCPKYLKQLIFSAFILPSVTFK